MNALVPINMIQRAVAEAKTIEDLLEVEAKIAAIERYKKLGGLVVEMRPYNEARMRARWRLGQLLSAVERGTAPGKGKMISQPGKSFLLYLKSINLDKNRAQEAQRIATMPEAELEKAFARAEKGRGADLDQ